MKIRKLHLKNIGVFDDETIEFKPCPAKDKAEIHIFTGQNGSGKSTILMALASVFDYYNEPFVPAIMKNSFYKRFRNIQKSNGLSVNFDDKTEFKLTIHNGLGHSEYTPYPHSGFAIVDVEEKYKLFSYKTVSSSKQNLWDAKLSFAVFGFSGYRQLKAEKVEAIYELTDFNPLLQSLEFVKDFTQSNQPTINQLIANNISNRALAKEESSFEEAQRYAKVIESIENAICEVTGYEIKFFLKRQPNEIKLKIRNEELDFDVLPDGLKSLISWIGDLLSSVDLLKWQDDLPINEKNLILFLDEIEVHLHPAWQRKVLPVVQKLFKNSQIFISTHSPFVINSVDDAWVYKLELENGKASVADVVKSEDGHSYSYVLSEIFDIKEEFGIEVQKDLAKFKELRNKIIASNNGSEKSEKELLKLAKSLAVQSEELQTIVQFELRQINKRTGKSLTI